MAEHDARQGLDLDIAQCGPLDGRKVPHLRLGEADVLDRLLRKLRVGGLDLLGREAEARGRPLVELFGIAADGGIALAGNVRDDPLDGAAYLRIVGIALR